MLISNLRNVKSSPIIAESKEIIPKMDKSRKYLVGGERKKKKIFSILR